MRSLRITDAESLDIAEGGQDVPAWVAMKLKAAGFDLTLPILYDYERALHATVFLQYTHRYEAEQDGVSFDSMTRHADTLYSTDADWLAAVDALAKEIAQREVA